MPIDTPGLSMLSHLNSSHILQMFELFLLFDWSQAGIFQIP